MDFDEIVVKEGPGLCRCCLSEGCYKDLATEYIWMNETEVYADMLLECFDISISQHSEGPNGPNRLICEVCITRLRDACNFKKQVLDSEKRFVDMVGRGDFKVPVVVYQQDVNAVSNVPTAVHSDDAEYLDEDTFMDDDIKVFDEKEDQPGSSEITVTTLPVKAKRGRPKKNTTILKPEKKSKLSKDKTSKLELKSKAIKGEPRGGQKANAKNTTNQDDSDQEKTEPINVKTLTDTHHKHDSFNELNKIESTNVKTLNAKDKRRIMRHNVVQVLIKSTVMPFRWLKSCYRCFYCYDIFQEPSELKSHQIVHESDQIKEQTMNNYWENAVYVDISNISCKLCTENITDFYDLIDHLIAKHGVDYNKDVGICMVPFKLDNFNVNCLACGAIFYTFGPLLHHTNKDHKGTSAILCEVCGQHFKDANLLKLHVKAVHENTGLLCTECGDKFETKSKLKTHQKNQHDMDRFKYKCSICPQTFQSHYKRSRHMATEHKNRQEIKCLHCPKTFVFRSMMMTHLRDTHLKVRNHECGVCGWKAFNSNRLKNHMYKHSGEKNFKCDACDKAFTTKKIMRAHYARMHKNVQLPVMQYDNTYVGH